MKNVIYVVILSVNTCLFAMHIKDTSTKATISIGGNQVVYIGNSKLKDDLERIYKKTFSLNTVFFPVHFNNIERTWLWGWLKYELECPEYIDYESVKNCKENEMLAIDLHGKKEQFICNQQTAKNFRGRDFHEVIGIYYNNFVHMANCVADSEQSLLEQKVIERNPYNVLHHGAQGNPEILALLTKHQ